MPFYLSLFSFLTSSIWMLYGILGKDPYLTVSITSEIITLNKLAIVMSFLCLIC
jgi:hypothetical protein